MYSREQKQSDFLFFKVSNTNMPHIFYRIKTFLFVKIESWNFQHLIVWDFVNPHKFSAHLDNFLWHPMGCHLPWCASACDYTVYKLICKLLVITRNGLKSSQNNFSEIRDPTRDGWIKEFIKRKWSSGLFRAVRVAEKKNLSTAISMQFLGWFFQLFVGKRKFKTF